MEIPKKIKIGGSVYNIKSKRVVDWKNRDIIGQINYVDKEIKIKKLKIADAKIDESTFFHEVAHGVLKELEYNHPKVNNFRNNEKFVSEMGLTLRTTFLDLLEKQR